MNDPRKIGEAIEQIGFPDARIKSEATDLACHAVAEADEALTRVLETASPECIQLALVIATIRMAKLSWTMRQELLKLNPLIGMTVERVITEEQNGR